MVVQRNGNLYYECCKDIPGGSELLVWYGDCYTQFMGIPVSMKCSDAGNVVQDTLDSKCQGLVNTDQ